MNFKEIKLFDLSGTEITNAGLHEVVANLIIKQATNSPIRNMELARKIYSQGEVELTPEDKEMIKNAVINSPTITDIAKEAILKAME